MSEFRKSEKVPVSFSIDKDLEKWIRELWKKEVKRKIEKGKNVTFSEIGEKILKKGKQAIEVGL